MCVYMYTVLIIASIVSAITEGKQTFLELPLANKITEIDLEVCEKAKFWAPFCGC